MRTLRQGLKEQEGMKQKIEALCRELAVTHNALRVLKDLHACATVRCPGEQCPICAMWRVIEAG